MQSALERTGTQEHRTQEHRNKSLDIVQYTGVRVNGSSHLANILEAVGNAESEPESLDPSLIHYIPTSGVRDALAGFVLLSSLFSRIALRRSPKFQPYQRFTPVT